MKKLLSVALLSSTLFCCTTEENLSSQFSNEKAENVTNTSQEVLPVYGLNGLHNKYKKKEYVNLQWYTNYDFPTFQPYYNTIRRNGVIVGDNYFEQYNRFGLVVESGFPGDWFSVTQTLIGIGTSEESFFYVPDMITNN